MLEIRVLGSPAITSGGSPVEVDTRKAIALLTYLAVTRTADRDVLAALFWADSPPDRARATLRRTLSSLRGGVGENALDADRNRVSLAGEYFCDIDAFDSLVAETGDHGHDPADVCPACVTPLSWAADLYRGDFLGAFVVRDAPDFEDWARSVTETYRLRAGEVMRRLAMAHAAGGDYTAAIGASKRWITLDDLHEPAHRLLMLLNAWAGDRPGAMEAYRDCVAILDRELGVAPLEETTELFEAILDEDLPPAPGIRRQTRAHTVSKTVVAAPMVDRRDAIETMEQLLADLVTIGRLVIVTGDSWMGKTRLLEHVTDLARAHGHLVATGTGFRAETGLPYGVAVQLLDDLRDGAPPSRPLPHWVEEELGRLDPRIGPRGDLVETGQVGQLRLHEAFVALIENITLDRPIVLTVDDAQWADPASAQLLAFIQRRARETRLLTVLSGRDVDTLHPALVEMTIVADDTIELGPLHADELQTAYPDVDLDEIMRATGGIPLLVVEAIDTGRVEPDSSTVLKYMDSRRRRMSELGRQVLAVAAVLDGMCDPGLLRDTSGRTEEEVVEAVEELVSAGLLREQADGRLSFTLDILETLTYESTSLIRRRLLHRRAAEALAARPRSESDARVVTATAEHLRAAGSPDAANWFRLAGDLARDVFAGDEATRSYESAIALGHPDGGIIRLALGELAMARGDYERASLELQTAAALSEGAHLALVEHRIGDLNRILGRFEVAEESFSRAEPAHPRPSELYADWALLEHRTGGERAVELAGLAESRASESGDDHSRARALNILGVVTPDPVAALAHIDAALEMIGPTDPARMAALNNKAHLLAAGGRPDQAVELVEEAIALAGRSGYRHHRAALLNHRADLQHQMGDETEANASLTEAVTIFADIAAGDWEPEVWLLRQW